jgi:copper chaperone CopZ
LEKLEGIDSVRVTLDPGRAIVIFDPARVRPEEMVQAIHEQTPFGASVLGIEEADKAPATPDCGWFGLFCEDGSGTE